MSSHDDEIGQEWAAPKWDTRKVTDLIDAAAGRDPELTVRMLGYLAAERPYSFRLAFLHAEHELGRHANGRCPEPCPRF